MMKIFEKKNGKVVRVDTFRRGCLIRLIDPTKDEIGKVIELLKVDEDFIQDPLDEDERARIEIDGNNVLVILKTPTKMLSESRIPYRTSSLGIIISPDYTVIISKRNIDFVDDRMRNGKIDIRKRSRMVFQILHLNATKFLWHLREIQQRIADIEEELHKSLRNKEIEELMNLEKSLVYFVTSLRSNEILIERLLKGNAIDLYEEDKDILEDALIDNRQAIDTANIFSDILAGMMDAYASIISNNLNIVMKVLAVMTIVLEIPTVITSFYGMNVILPLQKNPLAFLHVIIWSAISIVLILYWFRKKKWV